MSLDELAEGSAVDDKTEAPDADPWDVLADTSKLPHFHLKVFDLEDTEGDAPRTPSSASIVMGFSLRRLPCETKKPGAEVVIPTWQSSPSFLDASTSLSKIVLLGSTTYDRVFP